MIELDQTMRDALTKALDADRWHNFLSLNEYDVLTALLDACPEPPTLADGIYEVPDGDGDYRPWYVRDGRHASHRRPDGTLYGGGEPLPDDISTWRRIDDQPTAECCGRCPETMDGGVDCTCEGNPRCAKSENPTDEPGVGEQVTDCGGGVWQRFEDGWRWWKGGSGAWSPYPRTWDYVQAHFDPLRITTDDDRRRVGLPVRDEDTDRIRGWL